MGQVRTYEEIMANNGQYGSHQYQQPRQESDLDKAMNVGIGALKSGWSFLSKSASTVKQKANETGVTAAVVNTAQTVKMKADQAGVTAAL